MTNRYTMIYIPIFVNIVLLLLFDYRRLFFSLIFDFTLMNVICDTEME